MARGKTTPHACKESEITVQTFYPWRKESPAVRGKTATAKASVALGSESTFAAHGCAIKLVSFLLG